MIATCQSQSTGSLLSSSQDINYSTGILMVFLHFLRNSFETLSTVKICILYHKIFYCSIYEIHFVLNKLNKILFSMLFIAT